MRTKYSVINAITAVVFQLLNMVIVFFSRRIFLAELGAEMLGINSLFTQILSMLSLVELGIGSAIVFSLYRPLAEKDEQQIAAIMVVYRKAYTLIGGVIFILGMLLTPFIPRLISEDVSDIKNLYLIFMLYVGNTSLTYFSAYKQNLLIADQKRYITTIYHGILFLLTNVFQILILILRQDFVRYLVIQIVFTVLENVLLSWKTKREYPYVAAYAGTKVYPETLHKMKQNTVALLAHKIGTVVVNSTDALIISMCIGIITVGKYTNYVYVVNAFLTLASQLFGAVTASVGNVNVSCPEKTEEIFDSCYYFNYALMAVVSICCLGVFNDFIGLIYGKEMLLDRQCVFLLVLRFYIQGMRSAVLTFKEAAGLYVKDWYKPLLEALVNLLVSVMLAWHLGLAGVIIGTIACMILPDLLIEPYVVYRYIFHKKTVVYYRKYFFFLLSLMGMFPFLELGSRWEVLSFGGLLLKGLVFAGVSVVYVLLIGWIACRKELAFFGRLARGVVTWRIKRD